MILSARADYLFIICMGLSSCSMELPFGSSRLDLAGDPQTCFNIQTTLVGLGQMNAGKLNPCKDLLQCCYIILRLSLFD